MHCNNFWLCTLGLSLSVRATVDVSPAAAGVRRGTLPWTGRPLGREAQVSTTTIFIVCWDENTIVMHHWGKHLDYITNEIASFSHQYYAQV